MKSVLVCATTLGAAGTGNAAVVQLIENGILIGATGVEVTVDNVTSSYDVMFKTGSINSIYGEQASLNVYPFLTKTFAISASLALFDTVLTDVYNTSPGRTAGCTIGSQCYIATPYLPGPRLNYVSAFVARNDSSDSLDDILTGDFIASTNWSQTGYLTFAFWAPAASQAVPVPEPTTTALLGLGFLGMLGFSARRRKSSKQK